MGLLIRSVGTYADLPAASSIPAGTIIQVGNDPTPALNGFYRSNGSTWSSASGAPTGNAGGVLGYAGSTYPNPTGLAAATFTAGDGFLPIRTANHPLGNEVPTSIQLDNTAQTQRMNRTLKIVAGGATGTRLGEDHAGGIATLRGGAGSTGTWGGSGGSASVEGGDAANGNWNGGDVDLIPGQGSGTGEKGRIRLFGRMCLSVGNPETVANGSRIGSNGFPAVMHPIEHNGAGCTLDAAEPIVALTGGSDGTTITVVNTGSGNVTVPAGGNVMVENGANVVLAPFQMASFVWITMGPGGMWLQTTPKLQVG